ncbi:trehalase-domain-containing protein [Piromyces finnis]|uniref:alpha,alpha-trehalase n=1 Tax=Piromyces finnis TaxID=1754191 RepID=A0A1Y1VE22_9FUNG|nr:trehalase-domain-containing protein [Piromyces finnis]|eukprot:ORX53344.1 trehalase-domain-containing protein [Piromyces finnis]
MNLSKNNKLNNYAQSKKEKINTNNNKEVNISSNFGEEKEINRESIKSFLSGIIPNEKTIKKNKILPEVNDIVHGLHKTRALALIDQQNAIHEVDDLVNTDKDHRFAHGESHIFQRKRKMSVQVGESQSKKKFKPNHRRRGSLDSTIKAEQFIIDVDETQSKILEQEDTNGDFQITIDDKGPKTFNLGTLNSDGYRKKDIRGTYALSNLLQELALAKSYGRDYIVLDENRLNEQPINRLNRVIKYHFWDALTRRIDEQGLELILCDSKNKDADHSNRIYVPYDDTRALNYYNDIAKRRKELKLEVIRLPEKITQQYVKSIDNYPGILALALREEDKIEEDSDNKKSSKTILRGVPFVVPGGRFNEMYGWDSYFETLGLLVDERPLLGKSMVDNFVYQIEHYGKILNANRSYYLTRSQPPFLTDMINKIYYNGLLPKLNKKNTVKSIVPNQKKSSSSSIKSGYLKTCPKTLTKESLAQWQYVSFTAAIKELLSVWLNDPRIERQSGLSCYHTEGFGVPPETEAEHFAAILTKFGKKYNMDWKTFKEAYMNEEIKDPVVDEYFVHDRAVRESGHDTTYRLEKKCAHLACVDLNSLIFKYEVDIAEYVHKFCDDEIIVQVKKGDNDEYLENYKEWKSYINKVGYTHMIGNNSKWNSNWSRGIIATRNTDNQNDNEIYIKNYNQFKETLKNQTNSVSIGSEFFIPKDETKYFFVSLKSDLFYYLARLRKNAMNKYCWNDEKKTFYDWDWNQQSQNEYDSPTSMWPLWCGCAEGSGVFKFPEYVEKKFTSEVKELIQPSSNQAEELIKTSLKLFEVSGGIVGCTEESRGPTSLLRPNRQWDYPYGWAPHQIMTWQALKNYGHSVDSGRLAYRWLYVILNSFVHYNGVVPEKFNVVSLDHKCKVEYGNVGVDFKCLSREGFGWMNASFEVGITYLSKEQKMALGALIHPDQYFNNKKSS